MSITKVSAGSLKLERHIQCSLVMHGTLLIRVAQTLFNEAEIDASTLRICNRTQMVDPHWGRVTGNWVI